jgi:DNA-binding NarL/FixJ family response regulator
MKFVAKKRALNDSAVKKPIRVAVLESDPLRFEGLRALFGSEGEFCLRFATLPAVLTALDDDVVLLTANRGTSFYSAMSALKAVRPAVRVIVTGSGSQDEDILLAVAAGAKGYVGEDAPLMDFKHAIRAVHSGSVWVPGKVLGTFIERVTASTRTHQIGLHDSNALSRRQRQVLGLLAVGSSNKEIAKELGLSERTIKAHVAELLRKIGAPNRIALSVHPLTRTLLSTAG